MEEVSVTVNRISCCSQKLPIGVSGAPTFSFSIGYAPGFTYGGCQIQVASGYDLLASGIADMWESGTIRGEIRPVVYAGRPLESFTKYFWRVRVVGAGNDISEYSETGEFVTGAVRRGDWNAAVFTSADGEVSGVRRIFNADDTLEYAYLFIGCTGGATNSCVLHVNGNRIDGDEVFPGRSEPFAMYVRGVDVTELIRRKNSLVIDFTGRVSAIISMRYSGGRTEKLTGAEGWELLPDTPFVLRGGRCVYEEFDRAKAGADRYLPDGAGQALPQPPAGSAPMFVRPRMCGVTAGSGVIAKAVRPCGDGWLFDFGRAVAGYAGIAVRDQAAPVKVTYAERIDKKTDMPVCDGEPVCCVYRPAGLAAERYRPYFLHTVFRYILIEGLATKPELTDAVAVPVTSAPKKAEFCCSDETLNGLFGCMTETFSANLINLPTGHPGGNGAGEPAFTLACDQQLLLNDAEGVYRRFLEGMTDSQPVTGYIPSEFPSGGAAADIASAAAAISAVWSTYMYTGEQELLERYAVSAESFMHMLRSVAAADYSFEDQLLPFGDRYASEPAGRGFLSAALYFRTAGIMSRWCSALRDRDGADRYRELAMKIGNAINGKYLRFTAGRYFYENGAQSPNAVALAFGFCPDKVKESVAEALVADIRLKGKLTCGYIAREYIYEVLAENGYSDEVYRLILNEAAEYPALTEDQAFTEYPDGTGRIAHMALAGGYARWLTGTFVGLSFETPGGRRMRIRPYMADGIGEMSFSTGTVCGTVSVYWRREDDRISIDIDIPDDCEAVLCLPVNNSRVGDRRRGEQFVFRSGKHHITTNDRRTDSI